MNYIYRLHLSPFCMLCKPILWSTKCNRAEILISLLFMINSSFSQDPSIHPSSSSVISTLNSVSMQHACVLWPLRSENKTATFRALINKIHKSQSKAAGSYMHA